MGPTPEDIEALFPAGVRAAVREGAVERPLPEEEGLLGVRVVEKRRLDFWRGRAAARAALGLLDVSVGPILRGRGGEPLWPEGVTGSITHTQGIAAAAVARKDDCPGLGLDLEAREAAPADVARLVLTGPEAVWVSIADSDTRRTMVFSAKEAIFKALNPLAGVWLDFLDAELEWEPQRERFRATVFKAVSPAHPAGMVLEVRCTVVGDYVLSAVALT